MQRTCANGWCGQGFEVTDEDLRFLEKIAPVFQGRKESIPPPTQCSGCRQRRRWAWRNESSLYKRPCDKTGKEMISLYAPDSPYTVYSTEAWWGDGWDALSYGVPFDPARPFFDQFHDLDLRVPKNGMRLDGTSENSEYTSYGGGNKNCYLAFTCFMCEDVYYSWTVMGKNSMDCAVCLQIELLYQCFECTECQDAHECQNCAFIQDCRNCDYCICCKNLRHKSYHIFNKPVTKE